MIDLTRMAEATRLTRAGRLTEATALLRGQDAPPPGRARAKPRRRRVETDTGPGPGAHADTPPGARWTRGTHRTAEGARDYALYVPARLAAEPALLIMLHGCTQDAADFARGTRMNALADRHGFVVLYPEQARTANRNGCWNWFERAHQQGGEAAILTDMAVSLSRAQGARRRYVAGLSAGGAMAANLGAAGGWDGVAVHSGLAANAASDLPSALGAMRTGAAGEGALRVPTLVLHGTADRTVSPANAEAVAAQATAGARATVQTRTAGTAGGRRWSRLTERTPNGRLLCETVTVAGGGHGWFGGDPAGSHTERGVDASAMIAAFFELDA